MTSFFEIISFSKAFLIIQHLLFLYSYFLEGGGGGGLLFFLFFLITSSFFFCLGFGGGGGGGGLTLYLVLYGIQKFCMCEWLILYKEKGVEYSYK